MRISEIKIGKRVREDIGDLDDLCRSIEEIGLLQPIVVTVEHELVAGQRRVEAFRKLGRTDIPATVAKNLVDALLLLKAERDENVCRLDFNPVEAVAMGERLEKLEKPKAAARKASPGAGRGRPKLASGKLPQANGRVTEKIAPAVGMKRKTYEKAKVVVAAAKKDPKLFGAIAEKMKKTRKVDSAYKAVKKAEREQEEDKAAAATKSIPADDRFEVIASDFRTADVKPGTFDVVVTDPPYPEEFIPLYGDLAAFAARTLKPGGSLFAMCGQSYLHLVLPLLCERLAYHWTIAYLTPGGQAVQCWDRKVNTFWKPVIWLTNGKYAGEWIGDVCRSDVNDNDKDHHHWGQSESGMADLIARVTRAGNHVCDPFLGGGTTGVIATRLGRKFTGIEIDAKVASRARARILRELANG